MKGKCDTARFVLFCFCLAAIIGSSFPFVLHADQDDLGNKGRLTDPYRILNNYYDAVGGLEKLKSEKSVYYEAMYFSASIKGGLKYWEQSPAKWRRETSMLGVLNLNGCNGAFYWDVDRNKKIKIQKGPEVIDYIRVSTAMNSYRHMDPDSTVFSLACGEPVPIDGIECYVVNITNNLNKDIHRYYINRETFLLEKSAAFKSEGTIYIRYRKYRRYKGILRPLREEHTIMPSGGKYVLEISRLIINPAIDASHFEPPADDARDFHFAPGENSVDIPFKLVNNQILVPLEINGKKQEWLLDSGANSTVIDKGYARSLGILPQGKFKGRGAHSTFFYSYVRGPEIRLNGLKIDRQLIVAFDIPLDYNGILGYDFLSRFVTRIDYRRKIVSFYDPGPFRYDGYGKTVDAPVMGKDLTVGVIIDGKYKGRWRVDLGAAFTTFHYPYASENRLLTLKGKLHFSTGVGGGSKLRTVRFQTINIGGKMIHNPEIAVPIQPTGGSFFHHGLAGNLGNSILGQFTLYLDYKNQQIIIE